MADRGREEHLRRLLEGVEVDDPDPEFVSSFRARFGAEVEARHPGESFEDGDAGVGEPIIAVRRESDAAGARRRRWRGAAAVASAAAVLLGLVMVVTLGDGTRTVDTAGGPDGGTRVTGPPVDPEACAADVDLQSPGELTVATFEGRFARPDERDRVPARFAYESAVLYAMADRLGFAEEDVVVEFRSPDDGETDVAFAGPGTKDFDLAASEISVTDAREENVDFVPYYEEQQVLFAPADSVVAGAESLADLRDARLGTVRNTFNIADGTGTVYVEEVIAPSTEVVEFADINAALDGPAVQAALDDGTIDALVIDRFTADYALQAGPDQLTRVSVLGVLPRPDEPSGEVGLLFEQGSPLALCVEAAVAELRAEGALDRFETEYLYDGGSIPTLTR